MGQQHSQPAAGWSGRWGRSASRSRPQPSPGYGLGAPARWPAAASGPGRCGPGRPVPRRRLAGGELPVPFIADERRAGSTLLRWLMGLVDLRTDREVWTQYTSFVESLGPGILWSYGSESDAIAVGTTGGGRISQAIA